MAATPYVSFTPKDTAYGKAQAPWQIYDPEGKAVDYSTGETYYGQYNPAVQRYQQVGLEDFQKGMAGGTSGLGGFGGALGSLGSMFSGGGAGTGGAGTGGAGGGGGSMPSGALSADEKMARDSAYARAREQAGQTSGAALRSLQDLYAGQGLSGSTMEAAAAGQEIGKGEAGVTQFTREQYLQDLKRAQEQATMQYQGGITQRGQDVGFIQALMGLMGGGGTSTSTSQYTGQLY